VDCGTAPLLVSGQPCGQSRGAAQLVEQHGGVDQRAVGALAEIRRHGVCGVAHEHEPAVVPVRAVDPLHRMDGEVLEARDAGEQRRRRRIGHRPGGAQRCEIARGDRFARAARTGRGVDVDAVRDGEAPEEPGRGPRLFTQRGSGSDQGAQVRNSRQSEARAEAAPFSHARADAVGTDHEVGGELEVDARGADTHPSIGRRADDLGAEAQVDPRFGRHSVEQESLQIAAPDHPDTGRRLRRGEDRAAGAVDDARGSDRPRDGGEGGAEPQRLEDGEAVVGEADSGTDRARPLDPFEQRHPGSGAGEQERRRRAARSSTGHHDFHRS